jgi:hypothetical protein
MGSASRALVCAAGVVGASCAAIAGLEAPDEAPSPTEPSDGSAPTNDGASSGSSGSSDASGGKDVASAEDAKPDIATCVLKKLGETCTKGTDCCSSKCREDGKCVTDCQLPPPASGTCPKFGSPDCCIGYWCGEPTIDPTQNRCKACITSGNAAENNNPQSCCSKQANAQGACL